MRRSDLMDRLVPISALNQGQAAKILNQVTDECEVIVLKNNQAKAVIISPDQYRSYCELAEICNAIVGERMISKEEKEKICSLLKRTKLYTED